MLIYNMLQDMRHLVIADLRDQESFNNAHIRKAIRVDMETLKKQVVDHIRHPSVQSKYPDDDLVRVLFVLPRGDTATESKIR